MKSLLALDLGTKTGWAFKMDGAMTSGVWDFKPRRFDGGGMRFIRFAKTLAELHKVSPIGMVVYEEVRRHRGTDAAHCYGGLMAMLTAWCEDCNIPYEGVPVQTIKKFWTGNGNANKDMMIEETRKRDFNPTDDNEADALALLHYKLDEMKDGTVSLSA